MAVPLMAGLMIAQTVVGLGTQVVGAVQQHKMAEENKKAQEKATKEWEQQKAALTAQFSASTGLGGNLGGAVSPQMGQGGFPPGMGYGA
ncbi:MAG: hypothetical protein U0931_07570 [Vulcanimicrobiota bacterium]